MHRTRRLAAGATAKVRGQWQWAASNAYGRVGRFGTWHLKYHQYYNDSDEVDDTFLRVLTFMAELASALPVRTVQVVGLPGPPLIVYSDASWNDADDNRLGWIVADPVSGLAMGYTMLLTPEFVASWCPRTQQIAMAESCAGVIVPLHNWKQFRGRDVIWFIDNEAAARRSSAATAQLKMFKTSLRLLPSFPVCSMPVCGMSGLIQPRTYPAD